MNLHKISASIWIFKKEITIKKYLNCPSLNNKRRDLIFQLDSCKNIPQDVIKKTFANIGFTSVLNWFSKYLD